MAAQMLKGAAEILLRSGKHPGELKDRVWKTKFVNYYFAGLFFGRNNNSRSKTARERR
jgi:hypothetical protein